MPRGWRGTPPAGVTVYPAATTQLWILVRAFAQSDAEVRTARAFQDAVRIIAPQGDGTAGSDGDALPPPPVPGAIGYIRALDHVLRANGLQPGEEALKIRKAVLDSLYALDMFVYKREYNGIGEALKGDFGVDRVIVDITAPLKDLDAAAAAYDKFLAAVST